MRPETIGSTVYVRWYGKVLQGNVVNENDMMGMTAVRIPLQGQHPIALFTPGHVYDTADDAEISKSVPKIAKSVPEIEESVPKYSENVPKVSETSMCDTFKKSHWDHAHDHLMTDALDEFYSLWKAEHTPSGHTEKPVPPPSPQTATPPRQKQPTKFPVQLYLFD